MAALTHSVEMAMGIAESGDFIIGSSLIGSLTDLISDGVSIVDDPTLVVIQRGRWSQLTDVTDAGTAQIDFHNETRRFDPDHSAGPFYGHLAPGVPVIVTAEGVTIFTGLVDDWSLDYSPSLESTATLTAVDRLGVLALAEFDAWTANAGELPGVRLAAICDRSEVAVPSSERDFDAGINTLQGDSVTWGSNALNYAQLVARSDLGLLFAAADGKLSFRSRWSQFAAPVMVFADDGTGITFDVLVRQVGAEVLYGRVSVDREGGTAQTATVADPAAFAASYGAIRSLSVSGVLLQTDGASADMAEYLLARYAEPISMVREIGVELAHLDVSDRQTVLGVEIGDTVSLTFTPNGVGSAITQSCWVQGIRDEISPVTHRRTFSVLAADQFAPFTLDSATFGLLDVSRLAY